MKYLPLVAMALILTGCAREERQPYFPDACFSSREDLQELRAARYSSKLKALQEAPLFAEKIDPKVECYRFTWLRTWHHPVVLRLDAKGDGNGKLTIKVTDGAGGYDPGKLTRNESQQLDGPSIAAIRTVFKGVRFFDLPSFNDDSGLDGSDWIVEAVQDGKYHIVSRWSPKDGPVFSIGMAFLTMATGTDLTPIY